MVSQAESEITVLFLFKGMKLLCLFAMCLLFSIVTLPNLLTVCWSSHEQVFTTAAYDDHKNIVLLAFEIMEKIVRDYFPYITETESTTFTDCVNCLVAFTNSRFNKDISLSAIGFLRHCAEKLAEGDLGFSRKHKKTSGNISPSLRQKAKGGKLENGDLSDREDHLYFWFPLLAGKSSQIW